MHKILNIIILSTILTFAITATSLAAWQLTLDISTPDPNSDTGTAINKLTVGTDPTATDTYDNTFDTVALLKGPVQAYLAHPEYVPGQQKLWRDFRPDTFPKEWTVEVYSPGEASAINIKWGIDAPNNLYFTLVDQDSKQETIMTTSSEYSYNSAPNSQKNFLLRVSEKTGGDTVGGSGGNKGGSSSGGAAKGGGGCGTIKNVGRDGGYPGGPGSAALNIVILFSPLIWLTTRRVVISGVMVYVINGRKEIYRRHYGEKYAPWSNLPASFGIGVFNTKQLRKWWGGDKYAGRRRSGYSNPFLGCTNN